MLVSRTPIVFIIRYHLLFVLVKAQALLGLLLFVVGLLYNNICTSTTSCTTNRSNGFWA